MPTNAAIEQANALLRNAPIIDGHNDLPWALREMVEGDLTRIDLRTEQPNLHTDLPRLRRGGVGAQFWSVYVPAEFKGHGPVTTVLEQIDLVHQFVESYPEHFRIARTADEVDAAVADGRIASLLGAEGGHCIDDSLGVLRALYRLGVRYMTLTHNKNTSWADSATDAPAAGGLTDFGRDVVREMNRIGMLVDLSHVAETTRLDALEVSQAPVIFSHSSCTTVVDYPHNVSDDVLSRLPDNGGICMITFVPPMVLAARAAWNREVGAEMTRRGEDRRNPDSVRRAIERQLQVKPRPEATVQDVVRHIRHAREVAGIDHIGIGGDYDGLSEPPVSDLRDVSCYPVLIAELLDQGWSEKDCAKLTNRNILRVLRDAESVSTRLTV